MVETIGQRPRSAIQKARWPASPRWRRCFPAPSWRADPAVRPAKADHDATPLLIPFRQLPHLPFAEGKERRLRERKEETRPRKDQNQNRRDSWRRLHGRSMAKSHRERKKQNLTVLGRLSPLLIVQNLGFLGLIFRVGDRSRVFGFLKVDQLLADRRLRKPLFAPPPSWRLRHPVSNVTSNRPAITGRNSSLTGLFGFGVVSRTVGLISFFTKGR